MPTAVKLFGETLRPVTAQLSVLPLFILMGNLVAGAGISGNLFRAAQMFVGLVLVLAGLAVLLLADVPVVADIVTPLTGHFIGFGIAAAFGLVLHGDHDPHVAPGLHVARPSDPHALARLQQLARSWEMFDRAFEACPAELEQQLFDERIAPLLSSTRDNMRTSCCW